MTAKKSNYQTTINFPTGLDSEAIGQDIIDFIIQRSKNGLDVNNKTFPKYSESYKNSMDFKNADKSNQVDLTLSDTMLNSIEIIEAGDGFVTIGFQGGLEAEKCEGNQIGSYGQPSGNPAKARPFLGIDDDNLELIVAKHTLISLVPADVENQLIDSILSSYGLFDE